MRAPANVRTAAVIAAIAAAFFAGVWALPLQEPDEGRYAGIASEMLRGGDWITPHLNGIRYFEKPPLFFWLSAASMFLFGASDAAARLPSALSATLTAVIVMRWARRAGGEARAWIAGAALASLPLYGALSHVAIVDIVLTLWITLALDAAHRAVVEPPPGEGVPRRWTAMFALWLALATLTKGPVGAVLPAAAVVLYLFLARRPRAILAFMRPEALVLYALVTAPWYAAMELRNRGYLYDFIVGQNLTRFADDDTFGRRKPVWYYIIGIVPAFAPWIALVPGAAMDALRRRTAPGGGTALFALAAVAAPFAVLSAASGKLFYYLLPLAPPLSIAVAWAVASAGDDARAQLRLRRTALVFGAVCAACAVLGAAFALLPFATWQRWIHGADADPADMRYEAERVDAIRRSLGPVVAAAFAVAGAVFLRGARLVRDGRVERAAAEMFGVMILFTAAAPFAARSAADVFSTDDVAKLVLEHRRPGERVLCYTEFLRTLPYRLREPVLVWNAGRDEFGHAVGADEARGVALQGSKPALQELLRSPGGVLVVVTRPELMIQIERNAPKPPQVVARSRECTLVRCAP